MVGQAYLSDDESCSIVGMNNVQIETHEYKLYCKDVKQVKMNLVSVGQLGATGYTSTFIRDTWKVSNGTMVVALQLKQCWYSLFDSTWE